MPNGASLAGAWQVISTEILVVGGGTGATAAAIQAARRGAQVVLVSKGQWLGGMLTSAGVSAPDGNELAALQTGLWGAFLRELERRQPGGLDHAWVSFFTYEPRVGAAIFADWVAALPNLKWLRDRTPLEVLRQGDRITGVRFADLTVHAQVTLDGTELGDLLALGQVPHRWGWEWQSVWAEPSAPTAPNPISDRYPVQSPTWVVVMQDFGEGAIAPAIPPPPNFDPSPYAGAWEGYGATEFLNYGRLPGDRFMINWPQRGNDYGEDLQRLVESAEGRSQFEQEAFWHSWGFAHFIQAELGQRYGLAEDVFSDGDRPDWMADLPVPTSAFALHPYYRESRRLQGLVTVTENDILPQAGTGTVALPRDAEGRITAIAIGNYPNDHHYPGFEFPLQPRSRRWGGRWTGLPFALPYGCLVPATVEGLLVCEKNISVSHIANGATRLQPTVLNLGQAAGMAAALCIEQHCQPRDLPVRSLQEALITEAIAPAAVVPLLHLLPTDPDWRTQQLQAIASPIAPSDGAALPAPASPPSSYCGTFHRNGDQHYSLKLTNPTEAGLPTLQLVTLLPAIDQQLQTCQEGQLLQVWGWLNHSGKWLRVEALSTEADIHT